MTGSIADDNIRQVRTERDTSPASEGLSSGTSSAAKSYDENDMTSVARMSGSDDDSLEPFDRPSALPHFQALLAFVDEYLGKRIQLYERLREGKEQLIAFENLWMLFDAGDTIYCPLREAGTEEYFNLDGPAHTPIQRHAPQAYRVAATGGGMPLERVMAPTSRVSVRDKSTSTLTHAIDLSWSIRDNYTEFNVYCFYVDFNGIEYGTVREVFIFKPYEREMEIRALPAYPDRYLVHDNLHQRGEMFLQVTSISHLQYEGLAVGPNREEASIMRLHIRDMSDNVMSYRSTAQWWWT